MALDTNLNKASAFSYELVFPRIPVTTVLSENEELTLNIFGSIVPGLSLDLAEQYWMGAKTQVVATKLTFEPWNVNFIVDSEFKNWKVLYQWVTYINNNKDKFFEDYRNYVVDATIRILDNFRNQVFEIFIVDAWINLLGEITLSQREDEVLLESQASFVYDRYEIRE